MPTMGARSETGPRHPRTPDGRYIVVRGRLWCLANPGLAEDQRSRLVKALMQARRDIAAAKRRHDPEAERASRAVVDHAKRALGERGPVWWNEGSPDLNRRMVHTTAYADWFVGLTANLDDGLDQTP